MHAIQPQCNMAQVLPVVPAHVKRQAVNPAIAQIITDSARQQISIQTPITAVDAAINVLTKAFHTALNFTVNLVNVVRLNAIQVIQASLFIHSMADALEEEHSFNVQSMVYQAIIYVIFQMQNVQI